MPDGAVRLDAAHGGAVRHAGDPDADAARALDHGGDGDDGKIAVPARDLAERRRRRT